MTNFYADYITKTTFDPETNSVRSKLVEERGAPSSECCDAPLKNYNNGTGICHECGEHAGPTPEEHKEAATDMKKKPASKTPKVEVDATEIPEAKMRKCPETGKMIPVDEKLHGDQHKLDHNKDMKITSSDMKMVRKKGAVKNHPMEAEENPPMIIKSKKSVSNLRRSAASRPKGVSEDQLEEGSFKVQVDGLPTMYIDGSAGEIKASLRKKFKDPKAVISVERITPAEKKKELRAKVAEDQAAMDAYLKKGGTVKKLPAAHARSTTDMEKDVKGRVNTSTFKTRGKIKSMEDVEQVDELDKKTMGSYVQKSADDMSKQADRMARADRNDGKMDDAAKKFVNRRNGIKLATKKMGEETQVDEISNRAKGAYVRVAARDAAYQSAKGTSAIYNNDAKDSKRKEIQNADRIRNNRMQGIDRATRGMKNEGAMKRMATQDAEKERLGPRKVKGDGMDTFKKKPVSEKFAHAAQQAAVMAKLKASGKYKKPKESVEEKDTHVTKDGKTAKKGLWYNIHKKRARGEAPSKPGDPDRPSAADLKRSQ